MKVSGASHPCRGAVFVCAISGGVRAASFFVRTPASREALDHRLFSRTASGVPKDPAFVRAVSGGVRAATFFATTPASREALDHRLIFRYGLRRPKGPTFRAAEGGARSFPRDGAEADSLPPSHLQDRGRRSRAVRWRDELHACGPREVTARPGLRSFIGTEGRVRRDGSVVGGKGRGQVCRRGLIEYLGDSVASDGSGRRQQLRLYRAS
jgi:hypothetical protein